MLSIAELIAWAAVEAVEAAGDRRMRLKSSAENLKQT